MCAGGLGDGIENMQEGDADGGGNAEGVSYAIIIGNVVAPLLEKATLPKAFGREAKKA